jgi:predicted phage tail protein
MRAVKVYGQLAEHLGQRVFQADVASPAEAVRFLCANFRGLEQWLIDSAQDGIGFRVMVGKTKVGEDDFAMSCSDDRAISITPVLAGAGGGTGQILAGIGLVAAAIVLGPAAGGFLGLGAGLGGATGAGAAVSFGLVGGGFASAIGFAGVAMALSGTASLLSSNSAVNQQTTATQTASDPRKLQSFNFSGIQNTSVQGTPIPLVYGRMYTGSVVISAGISTSRIR